LKLVGFHEQPRRGWTAMRTSVDALRANANRATSTIDSIEPTLDVQSHSVRLPHLLFPQPRKLLGTAIPHEDVQFVKE
jgi:hypothetical protein